MVVSSLDALCLKVDNGYMKERITTKIYRSSLEKLKVIAAIKRESMPETLERLIETDYFRVVKELPRESASGLQSGTRPE